MLRRRRAHNALAAEHDFGRDFMQVKQGVGATLSRPTGPRETRAGAGLPGGHSRADTRYRGGLAFQRGNE
jgi:hypothetical protein